MPSYDVTSTEVEDLSAYLKWIASQRADLIPVNDRMVRREKFTWGDVPWFEYQ